MGTVVNGGKSRMQPVPIGVPEGSVLGPTLFAQYTYDLPSSVPSTQRVKPTCIYCLFFFFFENFNLSIATTHTDNTTLHDYLSCATITTLHYTAKPTYRNCTYIAVILLN